MLTALKKLAGGSRPATAAALKSALAEIDLDSLSSAVDHAETARTDALLKADERQLEKAEAALAAARRDLDRGRAAREALTLKIAEAEKAEAAAAIDAERQAVEAEAEAVAAELKRVYARAGNEIVAILDKLDAAEDRVAAFNARLAESSVELPPVAAVETRVLDHGENWAGVAGVRAITSLRRVPGCPGWGSGRAISEAGGLS